MLAKWRLMFVSAFLGRIRMQGSGACMRKPRFDVFTLKCDLPESRNYVLPWMVPGKVGSTSYITVHNGTRLAMITRALDPPIFEVPDFLTAAECALVIDQARRKRLRGAKQMGTQSARVSGQPTGRMAQTTFINRGRNIQTIRERTSMLTGVPVDLVMESEPIQVVVYREGGYYHSHFDSTWTEPGEGGAGSRPCCHHTWFPHTTERCSLCRYMTVLLYLNDVDDGGNTAFPLADQAQVFRITRRHTNLTENCQHSPLLVKPRLGKAVLWYNHHRDPQVGGTNQGCVQDVSR